MSNYYVIKPNGRSRKPRGRRKVTISTVISRMKREHPGTAEEFADKCKLSLQYIGSGCSRCVYKVGGLPLVVKFDQGPRSGSMTQAECEAISYKKLMSISRYKRLRKYLPKLYYFDKKTGHSLMHYYDRPCSNDKCREVSKEFMDTLSVDNDMDIYPPNVRASRRGVPKVIDMGCVHPKRIR